MNKVYFITGFFFIIFFTSCKETVPSKDASDALAGEFYYQGIDGSKQMRDIQLKVTDTGYKTFDVILTGFPGPFYQDSTANVKDIIVKFKIVVFQNTGYLDFQAEQDALLNGQMKYRAKFDIKLIPYPSYYMLKLTFTRTDTGLPYSQEFNYMMTKKPL